MRTLLLIAEVFYKVGFSLALRLRRRKKRAHLFPFVVIGVGNIAVGGTGKSVFIQMLARMLDVQSCALVLRGYKGRLSSNQPLLINEQKKLAYSSIDVGDEPAMHAQRLGLPVVICVNRYKALQLIERNCNARYVLLDDAYQQVGLTIDIQILLLDAQKPFDNGHCLPVGKLREKDISRADCIVLTHANKITQQQLKVLKESLHTQTGKLIFAGRHAFAGIFKNNCYEITKLQKYFLIIGTGSPDYVLSMLRMHGVVIVEYRIFPNHYAYTSADIMMLEKAAVAAGASMILCTEKDWVKIQQPGWAVVRVEFEFLTHDEYDQCARFVLERTSKR